MKPLDLDKRSFVMGMIAAFSECVAGGCKRLALSPPLKHEDYDCFAEEAYGIIEKHGLLHYHEENLDQPAERRVEWILIAGRQKTIDDYLTLRGKGFSPLDSLDPFCELLSYSPQDRIQTGYDAYRAFFPD